MSVKVTTDKYIYPPRPNTTLPRTELGFFKDLGWIAQIKYNGSRCMIKHLPDNSIQLWNRHGERFRTYHAPDWLQDELRASIYELGLEPNQYHLLDGELLDQKSPHIHDTIVIWDILIKDSEYLLGTTYSHRHSMLHNAISKVESWLFKSFDFGVRLSNNVFLARSYDGSEWDKLWDLVYEVNAPYTIGSPNDANYKISPVLEGLLLKDPNGELERGFKESNNGSWQVRNRIFSGRHRF